MDKKLYKEFVDEIISSVYDVFDYDKYMEKEGYKETVKDFYVKEFPIPEDLRFESDILDNKKEKIEEYLEKKIGISSYIEESHYNFEIGVDRFFVKSYLYKKNTKQLKRLLANISFLNKLLKKSEAYSSLIEGDKSFKDYLTSKLFLDKENKKFAKYILKNYYRPSVYFKPMKKLLDKIDNYVKEVIDE